MKITFEVTKTFSVGPGKHLLLFPYEHLDFDQD